MKRIGLFVDVSNLYYTLKTKYDGRKLDYNKMLEYIEGPDGLGEVIVKIAYGAAKKDQADGFKHFLKKNGFTVKYKEPKSYMNEGKYREKADHDVTIAMDIVQTIDRLDRIILCCSDGDLAPAVEFAMSKNVDVIVLASGISVSYSRLAEQARGVV